MKRFQSLCKACLAFTVVALAGGQSVHAATFNASVGSDTFTIVEADPFKAGDIAGNTLDVANPGTPWANTTNNGGDGLWYERAVSAFATGYESLGGATDRTFEINGGDRENAPDLETTVSGLAAGPYEVFVMYISRNDGNADNGNILADLNGPATTLHDETNDEFILAAGASVWDISLSQVGVTASNATSFTVQVGGVTNQVGGNRNDYLGVAYRLIPEPASIALLGLGGLMLLRRRN